MPTYSTHARIIVWSRLKTIALAAVFACLTFGANGPVAHPQAFATLGEAIAAALPAPPTTLTQEAYLKASNTDAADRLGYAVAIDGDTAVLTTINESSNATGVNGNQADNSSLTSGAAYVFVRTAGGWSQQAYLKASNTDANDQFGSSVAIDGNTIVVGAEAEDSNATTINGLQTNNSAGQAGAAYVFVRNGTTWSQQAYLKPSNMNAQDHFGVSVAVSGDTIAVGAMGEDSTATGVNGDGSINTAQNAGAAYIFTRSGTTWTQQAYIKSSNPAGALTGDVYGDVFGRSVSLDGNTLVVGAANEFTAGGGEDSAATNVNGDQSDNSAPQSGAAYVFVRNGTTWSQQAYLKAPNTGADDRFGYSVGVSGDTIVVGAFFEDSSNVGPGVDPNTTDNSAADSGAAYVYVRAGTTWAFQSMLKASNTGAGDRFGMSVAIEGDRIVVGAPQEDGPGDLVNATGAVYVFNRTGGVWTQSDYLRASNPDVLDQFGLQVALSGDTVLASALAEDSNATGVNGNQADNSANNAGAGYVFVPATNQAPTADAGADQFVAATSASGATVTLSGAGSADPDGDGLTYTWREGASVVAAGVSPSFVADFGTHTYTLTVDDGRGLQATDSVTITVADVFSVSIATPPPAAATYTYGQVVLAAYACSDSASILASCAGSVAVGTAINTLSLGAHTFEVTATNSRGDSSSMTVSYTVVAAPSAVAVTCPANQVYTGAAIEGCIATVTGSGGLNQAVAVTYSNNVNAGTATATATFAGDANHDGSTGTATFSIGKASSTVSVSCPATTTYTSSAQELCTATVTGVGGLNQAATVGYANNTNVGTASASASFAGDANHDGSTGSATFEITKASSTVSVSCPATTVYTGAAQELCSATVTGVGGLNQAATVTYTNNTNVGTASGSATFAGDANHDGSTGNATFEITKAALSVTADNATRAALAPNPVFTGTLTGVLGADGITATYSAPAATLPGTYPIEPSLVDPNGRLDNYTVTSTNGVLTVVDTDPPAVNVPAGVTVEATGPTGAVVTYADQVSAIDAVFGPVAVSCLPASGSAFPVGATTVQCTATDGVGNIGGASFVVTVQDTTAPTLTALDVTAVATDAAGIAVTYAPMGHDAVSGDVAAVCSPTSGTVFTIGDHTVSCAATDAAGNVSASATFTVHVLDGVAPTVTVPAGITAEATSASGAAVTFTATASDNLDETLTAECLPASGSTFPLGDTVVTCTVRDAANNLGSASFTVSVVDTTAPTLALPVVAPVVSMTPTAVVTYTVSATDIVDGAVTATCAPASGSAFPVGSTTVTCTATDAHGNATSGTFTVKVNDGVSPVVTVTPSGDRVVEATSAAGAVVTYSATAVDNIDGARPVTCSPASGSVFPIGPATVVTCSASDADGNVGTATFNVTVVDTTAPVLSLPSPITQATTQASGTAVTYAATATDAVDGATTVTCTPASGSTFPVGTTTVSCATSDARGNAATGSFTVTITLDASNAIGQFVAFSRDSTRLRSQVTVVSGDIGANQAKTRTHGHRRDSDDGDRDDITVQIGERSKLMQAGSRVVGDTVSLMSKASVYNVVTNSLINRTGSVLGSVTSPMTTPFLSMPVFPTVAAGTTAVTVKKNTSRTLAAGAYGAIKVENGATLILTGGLYQVLSIDVDPQGTILFRGASEVRVKTEFETGSKAKVILDQSVSGLRASQIVIYVLGADANCSHNERDDDGDDNGPATVHIGSQNVLQANIYAANGTVWLKSKTQATGAFIGQDVRIGERVTLTLDSAWR